MDRKGSGHTTYMTFPIRSVGRPRLIRGAIALANLMAAAASIATSPPPTWELKDDFIAPVLQIDDNNPTPSATLVVRANRDTDPSLKIMGFAYADSADADQQIRVIVREPGQAPKEALGEVTSPPSLPDNKAGGAGGIFKTVTPEGQGAQFFIPVSFSCGATPCEKTLLVTFERVTVTQPVHVHWQATASLFGEGTAAPDGTYVKVSAQ